MEDKEVEYSYTRYVNVHADLINTVAEQEWCANNLHRDKWKLVYTVYKRELVFEDQSDYFMFMLLGKKY